MRQTNCKRCHNKNLLLPNTQGFFYQYFITCKQKTTKKPRKPTQIISPSLKVSRGRLYKHNVFEKRPLVDRLLKSIYATTTKGLRCLAHRVKHNPYSNKLLRNLVKNLLLSHSSHNCVGPSGLVKQSIITNL